MDLREKVLLCMACCLPETDADAELGCKNCPYDDDRCGNDAQEVQIRVEIIEDIRKLLKAQEPQKVQDIIGTAVSAMGKCPACGVELNTSFLAQQRRTRFCYNCGQAVKWYG